MTKEINGVQKKVVQSLRKPALLGLYRHGEKPKKSNKQLSKELEEPVSNISYATDKLKEKDVIKDTEFWEGDKTGFELKEEVDVTKTYDFGSMIDNTATVHAISAVLIFLYSLLLAKPVFSAKGLFLTVFFAGLMGLMPSFFYNLYRIWTSLDSYKLLIELRKKEE